MEFSDTYKYTGPCAFSHDAQLLAVAADYRLVIRDVESLKVVQLYSCLDKIAYVEWAPDSEYILCGLYKRAIIQVWSISKSDWTCKIDEGVTGISHARWSPDSRHIITTSDFQLRLTVWSLVNTACVHVQWPRHASKGVSFTKDGKFAAIATRKDCKDYINLLACHSWEIMGTFAVDTIELSDLEWCPNDGTIAAWDCPLEYKVLIYSPDGRCLFKYQAYESGLGVKAVSWSPCGQFLSIGSYDQAVRLLNQLTWKVVAEFPHPNVARNPATAVVFKEIEEAPPELDMSSLCIDEDEMQNMIQNGTDNGGDTIPTGVRYKVVELPLTLPYQKAPFDKPNPKQGVGLMSWSADSNYILTRNDNSPSVLWIWDVSRLELAALLIHKEPIRAAVWDPIHPRVAICTGTSYLYMWTPAGACCVKVPLPQFSVLDLKWNYNGTSLLLKDREAFCCTFVPVFADSGTPEDQSSEDE